MPIAQIQCPCRSSMQQVENEFMIVKVDEICRNVCAMSKLVYRCRYRKQDVNFKWPGVDLKCKKVYFVIAPASRKVARIQLINLFSYFFSWRMTRFAKWYLYYCMWRHFWSRKAQFRIKCAWSIWIFLHRTSWRSQYHPLVILLSMIPAKSRISMAAKVCETIS